jgi:hypothetical protein
MGEDRGLRPDTHTHGPARLLGGLGAGRFSAAAFMARQAMAAAVAGLDAGAAEGSRTPAGRLWCGSAPTRRRLDPCVPVPARAVAAV